MWDHRRRSRSSAASALRLAELVYHGAVRSVRQSSRTPIWGLLQDVMQAVLLVAVFYFMFEILGTRKFAIRGDFLVYVMTGIFMFLVFNKSLAATASAEGPASAMMQHAPMNTVVALGSAALASLYKNALAVFLMLGIYHLAIRPVEIDQPAGVLGMFVLCWFVGSAVGVLFYAITPWAPGMLGMVRQFYTRANMITSGKMFVANSLPPALLAFFDWNPLFHVIDQTRGFAFVNYNPHFSSVSYPFWVGMVCLTIGLMAEFTTRRSVSLSWTAGR
ncbi:ABC-type polysaccharide/polyol phosphate export permease [Hasllibacter halocynthiae]|uniref:ABC-type polysaccharide/polyol phosphate export permease n=1 Tax=Hasllibacter halocynthiae TaxID=595589 RepID=A0A2T0X237_9RHOB|nr:ABC transporter permease [Hasllibacter halocynthiae]PRY93016.1 ABC-type polysaccharide/polyol phosphate export permease [Hasllibacter halocynthiae]